MDTSGDTNLVEIWLRRDPIRWIAGALAGFFAGFVALLFAMIMANSLGVEFWMPLKLPAIILKGASAMELGTNSNVLLWGFLIHQGMCIFSGIIFAHFTGTNSVKALLGVGFAWGLFSWVFINNLYAPAFREIFVVGVPPGAAFFVCVLFGISLSSVSMFDRMFRGK